MGKQTPGVGTKPPRSGARSGSVTMAQSKGMPLTGKVKGGGLAAPNHRIANNTMNRPSGHGAPKTGTQAPRKGARFGGVTRG